jgi:hypothetical protein
MAASDLGGLCVVGAVLLYVCIASFLPCRRSDESTLILVSQYPKGVPFDFTSSPLLFLCTALQPDNFAAQAPDKNVVESEVVVEVSLIFSVLLIFCRLGNLAFRAILI